MPLVVLPFFFLLAFLLSYPIVSLYAHTVHMGGLCIHGFGCELPPSPSYYQSIIVFSTVSLGFLLFSRFYSSVIVVNFNAGAQPYINLECFIQF